jgi:hypothetical protein
MISTDWAYLACIIDRTTWTIRYSTQGYFVNYIEFSAYSSAELIEWFPDIFKGYVFIKAPSTVSYISRHADQPGKKISNGGIYEYVKISNSVKLLDLITKTEPYLRRKKPYVFVMKEFLKSKIQCERRVSSEEREKRFCLIEEFKLIKKIHEERREDGI